MSNLYTVSGLSKVPEGEKHHSCIYDLMKITSVHGVGKPETWQQVALH